MALNDIIERETDTDSMTVDDVRDYLDSYTPKKKSSALKRSLVGLLGGAVLMFGSCVQNGAGGGGGGSVNTPPEISASYDAGTVTVRADDVDGVIAEMYQNGSSILAQDTNPAADVFEAEFDGLAPGDYEFRAVDDAGAAVSDVVTVPQTGPDPYESIDATIDLSASSVQHNMDAAAEVYASVDVTDGGYDTAKWFADGQEIGTSTHGNDFGIDVDWVGVKEITAEFYNSLDEKLDTVSAGNLEGLNTAPNKLETKFLTERDGTDYLEVSPGNSGNLSLDGRGDANNDSIDLYFTGTLPEVIDAGGEISASDLLASGRLSYLDMDAADDEVWMTVESVGLTPGAVYDIFLTMDDAYGARSDPEEIRFKVRNN